MIILIVGETGSGKTSLGVAFGIKDMDNGDEQIELAQQSQLTFPDYANVELPKDHLVYGDIFISGSENSNQPNTIHFTTGYRFGLPNDDFETDYFPYGSTIIFDEARKYFPARKSMKDFEHGGIHEKTFQAFELNRQHGLKIILITQLINHIDINIRSLANIVIEPYEITQEKSDGTLIHIITKWKCRQYGSVGDFERYKSGDKNVVVEDVEFAFNDDIFEYYDTEYFNFMFMKGLKKYSNITLPPCDGTKKSVNKLYELYGNIKPIKKDIKV